MSCVYAFMAEGCEEVEALTVVDLLRRAEVEVIMVNVTGEKEVIGSHGIAIGTDETIKDITIDTEDLMFLPGGMPGTTHLSENTHLTGALQIHAEKGGRIAAICAAPSVLGTLGILEGKKVTCYPGFEESLKGAEYLKDEAVVTDGMITTARGMGAAVHLGLELISILCSEELSVKIAKSIMLPQ